MPAASLSQVIAASVREAPYGSVGGLPPKRVSEWQLRAAALPWTRPTALPQRPWQFDGRGGTTHVDSLISHPAEPTFGWNKYSWQLMFLDGD